jgi:nucleoside 2-deoxyribosyltransferase
MENVRRCVYLAGPVEYEGDTWRERARAFLEKLGFETIDPIRGEQLKRVGKHIESDVPDKVIVMRDLNDLRRVALTGGLVVMNLSTTSDRRKPIGTLFELQWCYDNQVPVIAVMGRDCGPNYRTHPWIRTMVTYGAPSVTAALEMVESYFT